MPNTPATATLHSRFSSQLSATIFLSFSADSVAIAASPPHLSSLLPAVGHRLPLFLAVATSPLLPLLRFALACWIRRLCFPLLQPSLLPPTPSSPPMLAVSSLLPTLMPSAVAAATHHYFPFPPLLPPVFSSAPTIAAISLVSHNRYPLLQPPLLPYLQRPPLVSRSPTISFTDAQLPSSSRVISHPSLCSSRCPCLPSLPSSS
ncbi:hypothetical protein B296_00004062 [Ensete ventricosum]|uniref:Uncharacterized protein n=1 Tax=Ensete ventricosum TaxID=4639 RepID=A0A427A3L4_ENSVE|nr:hypothetical protein B296_00004062 [Ensete ventricosum]